MSAAKFAYRINEAAEFLGVSRTTVYDLVAAGELELGKIAGRSVIKATVLQSFAERAYHAAPTPRSSKAA